MPGTVPTTTVTMASSAKPVGTCCAATAGPSPLQAQSPRSTAMPWGKGGSGSHFAAGAFAGTVAAVVMCPLEVLKIRLQAASTAQSVSNGWRSSLNVASQLRTMARAEGVVGMWRGVGINVAGVAPARSLYFGVYDYARKALAANGVSSSLVHMSAAGAAGMCTSTLLSPLWVIKTRLQIQTNQDLVLTGGQRVSNYRGPFDAFRCILREEGARAFYKGLSATYLGVTEGAIQFMLYQEMKAAAAQRDVSLSSVGLFGVAALAKFVATTLTYPHEVVRTRLRDRKMLLAPGGPKYTGLVQCFKRILAEEGVAGLYAGLGPHIVRVVPNAALIFVLVEWVLGGQM